LTVKNSWSHGCFAQSHDAGEGQERRQRLKILEVIAGIDGIERNDQLAEPVQQGITGRRRGIGGGRCGGTA
jgi:hypothetical protein